MLSILLVAAITAGGAENDRIKERCAREWPADYQMQEYCYDQQLEAAMAVKKISETYGPKKGTPEFFAFGNCLKEWSDGETYDYQMVNHCFTQQKQSIDRLKTK